MEYASYPCAYIFAMLMRELEDRVRAGGAFAKLTDIAGREHDLAFKDIGCLDELGDFD